MAQILDRPKETDYDRGQIPPVVPFRCGNGKLGYKLAITAGRKSRDYRSPD
jgi:hypothetical protein